MDSARQTLVESLHRLARMYRVLVYYWDGLGVHRQASPEALLAVLRELGAAVESLEDAPAAVEERRQSLWRQFVEPVAVVWDGAVGECLLRLPAVRAEGKLGCELELENGETAAWPIELAELPARRSVEVAGERYIAKLLRLPASLPWGYHRLRLEHQGGVHEATVISAPSLCHQPAGLERRGLWGVFLPLYALHSERSWGAGDLSDLSAVIDWSQQLGGGLMGVLPLLATFLDRPCDPSPYTPVSRLFWNEFYVDPRRSAEWERCPAAREVLATEEGKAEVEALRQAPLVDYSRQMALKRRVLQELAGALVWQPSARRNAFWKYVTERPKLSAYARFRATVERRQTVWGEWPAELRDGHLKQEDFDDAARIYHLYAQWLADEQLAAVAEKARRGGPGLYLDLPLGVHPGGFDVWSEPDSFALGVAGGAPPDAFFTKGQNWGFAPLHPDNVRRDGYQHFIACLRHHLQYAGVLRIDHVMGLHRLYWIPRGMTASEGVYVHYRPEELYAILAVESHRHQATIVGEDLGTVPDLIRRNMTDHGLQRMYVAQFECEPDPNQAMHAVPAASLASLNTHDMRPFASFWEGSDIQDQTELGLLDEHQAEEERRRRWAVKWALGEYLEKRGRLEKGSRELAAVLEACLAELSAGSANMLLVNLEDLWQESMPQNTPGTVDERPNWRRRARHSLEEFSHMREVAEVLQRIDELRRRGHGPGEG